jgi:hypothetical protein
MSTLYPVGRFPVGVAHETVMLLDVVETDALLNICGLVVDDGHDGATTDVVADSPRPSAVSAVTRNVCTTPAGSPVRVVVVTGDVALVPPRFGLTTVHVDPPSVLRSTM